MQKVISVFGSAAPQSGSDAYEVARQLGRRLAEAGLAVATGGYSGTMTAVSQGAAEADGRVIGVTSSQIEQFRPIGANRWVQEEIRYETLRERMLHLVVNNDGMIVLPGGIGTLAELALAWSFMQVGEMPTRPFVLLGPLWESTMAAFIRSEYVSDRYVQLLYFADSVEAAVDYVRRQLDAVA